MSSRGKWVKNLFLNLNGMYMKRYHTRNQDLFWACMYSMFGWYTWLEDTSEINTIKINLKLANIFEKYNNAILLQILQPPVYAQYFLTMPFSSSCLRKDYIFISRWSRIYIKYLPELSKDWWRPKLQKVFNILFHCLFHKII